MKGKGTKVESSMSDWLSGRGICALVLGPQCSRNGKKKDTLAWMQCAATMTGGPDMAKGPKSRRI